MNSYRMCVQCCWKKVSLHICFQFVFQKQLNDYEIVLWVKHTSRVTDIGITLVKLSNGSCRIDNPAERVLCGQIGIYENSFCSPGFE